MKNSVLITRVVLKNYKSIAACSVALKPLVFLVGQNGAGKSNFLDGLRFVTEALNTTLDHALRDRGGINEVRRRSSGHPTHFGIRLEFCLPDGRTGFYAFRVGAKPKGGFEVQQEQCRILTTELLQEECHYTVESGQVTSASFKLTPPAANDRLYLVLAAGLPEFRPLFDCLTRMGFYNLNPEEIRDLQPPDPGEVLHRDGRNLASILNNLAANNPSGKAQLVKLLSKVVPGVTDVNVCQVGKKETLEFRQKVGESGAPWRFMAENMSDGTLRALGVLTALFQGTNSKEKKVPLIGIEEPEVALHPGAAGILREGLKTAAKHTQILVTSHSPELLNDKSITDENILSVINRNGDTVVGPVDETSRIAIKDQLFTAGELLGLDQLSVDEEAIKKTPANQLELFADLT